MCVGRSRAAPVCAGVLLVNWSRLVLFSLGIRLPIVSFCSLKIRTPQYGLLGAQERGASHLFFLSTSAALSSAHLGNAGRPQVPGRPPCVYGSAIAVPWEFQPSPHLLPATSVRVIPVTMRLTGPDHAVELRLHARPFQPFVLEAPYCQHVQSPTGCSDFASFLVLLRSHAFRKSGSQPGVLSFPHSAFHSPTRSQSHACVLRPVF